MRVRARRVRIIQWLATALTIFGITGAGFAQTTVDGVLARLKGKPLFLRGMYGQNELSFDAAGKPLKPYTPVPFTEAAMDVYSVKITGNQLRIEGWRMGLQFNGKGVGRRVQVKAENYDGKIQINISGAPGTDYAPALDAIFAPDLASLTPSLPSYWQHFALAHFAVPESTPSPASGSTSPATKFKGASPDKPMSIGGSVKPPKILTDPDPEFTPVAKALGLSGKVQLYLWLLEDGTVTHVYIEKALGLGLDEASLSALQKYKFAPATQYGRPVKVELYIDFDFEIR